MPQDMINFCDFSLKGHFMSRLIRSKIQYLKSFCKIVVSKYPKILTQILFTFYLISKCNSHLTFLFCYYKGCRYEGSQAFKFGWDEGPCVCFSKKYHFSSSVRLIFTYQIYSKLIFTCHLPIYYNVELDKKHKIQTVFQQNFGRNW